MVAVYIQALISCCRLSATIKGNIEFYKILQNSSKKITHTIGALRIQVMNPALGALRSTNINSTLYI